MGQITSGSKSRPGNCRYIPLATLLDFSDWLILSYFVGIEVNPAGKPWKGDPHARFDERVWETGP
jgi:hypothetical protein